MKQLKCSMEEPHNWRFCNVEKNEKKVLLHTLALSGKSGKNSTTYNNKAVKRELDYSVMEKQHK